MDEAEKSSLAGRPVELRAVGFGYALESNRIREEGDSWKAAKFICVLSAHWADTGERVFKDVDAIDAWPMRDSLQLVDLIRKAGAVNSPRDDTALPNGQAGEPLRPSR